jgi:uncharacterized protein (DUF58 family)
MIFFSTLKQTIKKSLNKRFEHWLRRRMPSRFQHKLSNRNIFILPTRFGFMYLIFDVLLFLLGTNYQNNIILLLSYLLASLFITVMMHSFYNFSQLTFSSKPKQTCFAKQVLNFPIHITGHKTHFDINFQFSNPQYFVKEIKLSQIDTHRNEVILPWYAKHRGVYSLGRVKVFSEYSLGLFITWSMLDFSHQAVVFPEPKKLAENQQFLTDLSENDEDSGAYIQTKVVGDDYSELKEYVLGESQARVAWKQLARGQGKLSKQYQSQQEQGSLLWLRYSQMPSLNVEENLQFLCFLILEYARNNQEFGLLLDLPSISNNKEVIKIEPNSGSQHQEKCLIALAHVNNPTHDHNLL